MKSAIGPGAHLTRKPARGSRIANVRATTVTVPLEAPLRHAAGAHWGRFVRTIVEIETESGGVGLGEMGGGGQSAQLIVESLRPKLLGHDVFDATALWFKVLNPTAALYDNRTQIHAALEFACLDAAGKILEASGIRLVPDRSSS
jgi:glucarate dehydratase